MVVVARTKTGSGEKPTLKQYSVSIPIRKHLRYGIKLKRVFMY